jgi:Zn-finger nucleic acid-binding protein
MTVNEHPNAAIVAEGERKCAICGARLVRQLQESVAVDVCDEHGIWLDKDALPRIFEHRRMRATRSEGGRWNGRTRRDAAAGLVVVPAVSRGSGARRRIRPPLRDRDLRLSERAQWALRIPGVLHLGRRSSRGHEVDPQGFACGEAGSQEEGMCGLASPPLASPRSVGVGRSTSHSARAIHCAVRGATVTAVPSPRR